MGICSTSPTAMAASSASALSLLLSAALAAAAGGERDGGGAAAAAAAAAAATAAAAVPPPPRPAVDPASGKLLFVDRAVLSHASSGVELEMHEAQKLGAVITATEPWEAAAVYAYNTMVRVNDTTFFMYYDVIASNGATVGDTPTLRFTALAVSNDGTHFTKPNLGGQTDCDKFSAFSF
jgi:hypothetical protein